MSPLAKLGLQIWDQILGRNKGISMDFILGRIPAAPFAIFADASTSWGIGGCYGRHFFLIPWSKLQQASKALIAHQELLACLVSIMCFGDLIKGKYVRIHTDNSNP